MPRITEKHKPKYVTVYDAHGCTIQHPVTPDDIEAFEDWLENSDQVVRGVDGKYSTQEAQWCDSLTYHELFIQYIKSCIWN